MKSITQVDLSHDDIRRLAMAAFGDTVKIRMIERVNDGSFNTVYSVVLDDMGETMLKVSPPHEMRRLRYEKNIMKAEVEALRLVKSKGIVPVPEVYFYDDSRSFLCGEYFFMEKIEGKAYNTIKQSLSSSQRESVEIKIGEANRLINDMKGEYFGDYLYERIKSSKWSDAFHTMFSDVLEDGREHDVALPEPYEYIDKLISDKISVLDFIEEPSFVHWDLWDGNVFIDANGEIVGVIDFERALWGDPLIEVYFSRLFDNTNIYKGYGNDIFFEPEVKCRRVIYNIYLFLIKLIECSYRGYKNEVYQKSMFKMLDEEIKILRAL